MSIQRYGQSGYTLGHMIPKPLGDYVLYTDHIAAIKALEAKLEEAERRIEGMEAGAAILREMPST